MEKDRKVHDLSLSSIEPDENQPRRNFDVSQMAHLIKSIKQYGIKDPLQVEVLKGGKYRLVDGERRYRAAKELGLKSVPALLLDEMSQTERMIIQFNIQEQHLGWTPIEKAIAVSRLSEELNIPIKDLADQLSLPSSTVHDYVALSKLSARKSFEKYELPIDFAKAINGLTTRIRQIYTHILGEEFSKEMQLELEEAVIRRIKNGDISKRNELLFISDAAKMDPKYLEKYIKDSSISTDKLYTKTNAKLAHFSRNTVTMARNIAGYTSMFGPEAIASIIADVDRASIQKGRDALEKILALIPKN